jgi:hypothetical protein
MKIITSEKLPIKMCECGCGKEITLTDKYGRSHDYISGHNGRKYDNPTQYKREWNHRNQKSRYESKIERGHTLKVRIINLMGGECSNPECGLEYNGKNACVFQCHHIDPSKKLFAINTRTLNNYTWNSILEETEKCQLLCANCHFIKENKEY